MNIIQPFPGENLQDLLSSKKILSAKNEKTFRATIFPNSTEIQQLPNYTKDRLITKLDDSFFNDFILLKQPNDIIINTLGFKKIIRSIEIGDYNDSVKRYTNLDKPIDYNVDNAQNFLNLPIYDHDNISNLNVEQNLIYNAQIDFSDFETKPKPNLFDDQINHPHINSTKVPENHFKYNDKTTIEQIFKWAKEKNILYIYCIIENRPYSMTSDYVTPYVYYTIKGMYAPTETESLTNQLVVNSTNPNYIIDEFDNNIEDDLNDPMIY